MTRVVKKLGYKNWQQNTIEAFYLKPLKTAFTKFNLVNNQTETKTQ